MISKDFSKGISFAGKNLHQYINELFGDADLFTVGECWGSNVENIKLFCRKERRELSCVFQFDHLCINGEKFSVWKPELKNVCEKLDQWQTLAQQEKVPYTLFFENHDQPRSVSRFGDEEHYRYESATMLATLLLTGRGIPFIYQGQEFGITNSLHHDISEFQDIESVNYYNEHKSVLNEQEIFQRLNRMGRDNARRMVAWTKDMPKKSWIAPYTFGKEINLESDVSADKSIYKFYRSLIKLRKSNDVLKFGCYKKECLSDKCFIYSREYCGQKLLIICNFSETCKIDLKYLNVKEILCNNYDSLTDTLNPFQALVCKVY